MMAVKKQSRIVSLPEQFIPQFWDEADGRCSVIKEIRHRYEVLKGDTQADNYQKDLICQRAIFISVQLETMEMVASETGSFNAGVYTQMVNSLMGLLKSLGLERKRKNVVSLQEYVGQKKKA